MAAAAAALAFVEFGFDALKAPSHRRRIPFPIRHAYKKFFMSAEREERESGKEKKKDNEKGLAKEVDEI